MNSRSSKWVRGIGAVVLIGGLVMGTVLVLAATTQAGDAIDDPIRQPHLKSWSNVIPVARRFVVLADFQNAAVLDRETGLVWEHAPSTAQSNWSDSTYACVNRFFGGRRGWRLPSVVELASLMDPSLPTPFIPTSVFPDFQLGHYWSATTSAGNPNNAWSFDFTA